MGKRLTHPRLRAPARDRPAHILGHLTRSFPKSVRSGQSFPAISMRTGFDITGDGTLVPCQPSPSYESRYGNEGDELYIFAWVAA